MTPLEPRSFAKTAVQKKSSYLTDRVGLKQSLDLILKNTSGFY